MMESRGISLRKKRSARPKISAPQQITAPANGSTPSLPPPPDRSKMLDENRSNSSLSVPRDASTPPPRSQDASPGRSPNRENTADYVKRRYSRRIPQLPKDYDPSAPPIPTLPSQIPSSPPPRDARRLSSNRGGIKVFVDVKALQNPNLSPDQYVSQILANASDQDIRDYQADLSRFRNRNSTDLQHNVYQNRDQFIKISQEAEKLKGEMRALRNLMSELTSTLGQTNAALGIETDAVSTRKYANRSSVANLEAMWSTHLQELWRRVEGSQKFLPAIPGRHVIHESGRWVELNTATWKPRRRVHLILLNDHLLVAAEKKRGENSAQGQDQKLKPAAPATQLIADRCWPLQDVEVADLASNAGSVPQTRGGGRSNTSAAINVRVGTESFTCAATDAEGKEKLAFLAKYKKAVTDLRKALQVEADEKPAPRNAARRPVSSRAAEVNGSTETFTAARNSMTVDFDGKALKFNQVEAIVDQLDIDIALQHFEEAVGAVEKLRRIGKSNKGNYIVQDLVDGRVHERAGKLAQALTRQLSETNSYLSATKQNVTWMTKLGFEVRASEAFLEARSNVIKQRISQCTDQGDLYQYLYQLSYIYFTGIRHTVSIYQGCFSTAMSSACVKWAKEHVDRFNVILGQQLSKLEAGSDERQQCLEKAREHAAMLSEVGIDFRNLVGQGMDES